MKTELVRGRRKSKNEGTLKIFFFQAEDGIRDLVRSRGLDINVGTVHPDGQGSASFTLWDVTAVDSDSGQRILTGPVLVYFRRNIAARLEYKLAAYDDDDEWSGNYLSFTLGIVY